MSKKSSFMNKIGFKKNTTPRSFEEITKEYGEVSGLAAQASYMIFLKKEELLAANKRMKELNNEAAERNKLTAEEAKRQTEQGQLKAVDNE